MTLAPGSKLGPYEILTPLGAGAMGMVYRARDSRLQRDVAIKVLPPGALMDDSARKRFRKEALALAKLSHPNIATVYDVGEQDDTDYLVMELVSGKSLASMLEAGPLPVKDALSLSIEIAAALEEAHEAGVVHRDLKPANIMVTTKGHAKVLDFGIAKLLAPTDEGESRLAMSETQGVVGTPLYMSPEQAFGQKVDSRTDLWSLGVVLYETLTGKTPFQGTGVWALFSAIGQEIPTPVSELRPDVPKQVENIVSLALTKDPARRYQSAAELSRDASAALTLITASQHTPVPSRSKLGPRYLVAIVTAIVLLVASGGWAYLRSEKRHWARDRAIPESVELDKDGRRLAALQELQKAQQYLPKDTAIASAVERHLATLTVTSSPPGATVEVQDYTAPDSVWHNLGTTPISAVKTGNGFMRWRLSKAGLTDYVVASLPDDEMRFQLDSAEKAPPGMVWVGARKWGNMIAFVGWVGPYSMPSFYVDRFEVTNRQYQEFVDQGGYTKKEYWTEKFTEQGRELRWEEAIARFRDKSGRAGPSTWTAGHFPDGQDDYPVSGVSWYEASAYAAFAGKMLPTLAQWFELAPEQASRRVVQLSNFSRTSVAPVGRYRGLGVYGTYDQAGNVREWTRNELSGDQRFILGGSFNSQAYMYSDPETLSPYDRSPENGFRCVRNLGPLPPEVTGRIKTIRRDFTKYKPVSDEGFKAYKAMYAYDRDTPLETRVEGVVEDTGDWREEKITVNTAYSSERLPLYLFLPKKVKPPYQAVVFFPSARILYLKDSKQLGDLRFFDYVIQSGRAVMYPVYQETYERRFGNGTPGASQIIDLTIQRYRDVERSLDYLASRPDIAGDKLAYLGVSMGAAEGVIYTALAQDRLKAAVFLDGGYFLGEPPRGGDQADFAPRIKIPVLMVNGRYDFTFSYDHAQVPLFRTLGTPDADKRHVVLETPHDVTALKPELTKEVLGWLDKYLGRVE